jgi:hypothetical protein
MYKCFRLFSSSCVEKWIAEDNGAAKEMQIRPTLMNPMKAVFISKHVIPRVYRWILGLHKSGWN